jgi:hypothetical protein
LFNFTSPFLPKFSEKYDFGHPTPILGFKNEENCFGSSHFVSEDNNWIE